MEIPIGVKTIDDYKKLEETFKEYLIETFGVDKEFDKYPLVEVRVSNLNKIEAHSPPFAYRDGDFFDMISEATNEITFSIQVKIRKGGGINNEKQRHSSISF